MQAYESLQQTLDSVSTLDPKLADYVFFPLSYLFRESTTLPAKATQTCLLCLQKLIADGWRQQAGQDLCKQLLILLSFLAGGNAVGEFRSDVNEQTCIAALQCLAVLFQSSGMSVSAFSESLEAEGMLVMGHVVSVILAALNESPSVEVQIAAVHSIDGLILCIADEQVLRNFLPGIVSSLTKTLQPQQNSRRSYRVLSDGLHAMAEVLQKTLGDIAGPKTLGVRKNEQTEGDESWLKATAAQVKLALANIVTLRYHERSEVLSGLFELCTTILQYCCKSLEDSIGLILETSVIICSQDTLDDKSRLTKSLEYIITMNINLQETLKASIFDWSSALPRVMQSIDDSKRSKHIAKVATARQLIAPLEIRTEMLDSALASSIREATTAILSMSKPGAVQSIADKNYELSEALETVGKSEVLIEFTPVPLAGKGQNAALQELQGLIRNIESLRPLSALKTELAKSILYSSGTDQLAAVWLSCKIISQQLVEATLVDEFLDLPPDATGSDAEFNEVVYSHSLDILSVPAIDDGNGWRLQALALEIVAFESYRQKKDFRPELVDALYSIVERIGSTNSLLREHAMTCLNIVSRSCEYPSSSDMIIQNVDYLVNAVSLKFNTFDISPQVPQVLCMMLKLCGPTLIPYLDDVIESIFSALANFHGYPRLVDSLFTVLSVVVEEGAKSTTPLIQPAPTTHRKSPHDPKTMAEVLNFCKTYDPDDPVLDNLDSQTQTDTAEASANNNDTDNDNYDDPPESKPTPSKTYTIINRIILLTQHHLSSSCSPLRLHLLHLIRTAAPALAQDEDTFLPLLNDIWPPLLLRLYDPETFVAIGAADTLATLLHHAGDFLSSRVQTEWAAIRKLWTKIEDQTSGGVGGGGRAKKAAAAGTDFLAHGRALRPGELSSIVADDAMTAQSLSTRTKPFPARTTAPTTVTSTTSITTARAPDFSSPARFRTALRHLLTTIVRHVNLTREMETELFEQMLGPLAGRHPEVREALDEAAKSGKWGKWREGREGLLRGE